MKNVVVLTVVLGGLGLLGGGASAQDFLVVDPSSPAYQGFAAVSGAKMTLPVGSEITGNLHGNQDIYIGPGVRVEGDVSAAQTITSFGEITGAVEENAEPLALPTLPPAEDIRAIADRVFEGFKIFRGDEVLDGIWFVDGTAVILKALTGTGTLVATRDILFLPHSDSEPDPTARQSFISYRNILVAPGRKLNGIVLAERDLSMTLRSQLDGVAIAKGRLLVWKDSAIRYRDHLGSDEPPFIDIVAPVDGAVVEEAPFINVRFGPPRGVRQDTLSVTLDGVDLMGDCIEVEEGAFFCVPPELTQGIHEIAVGVDTVEGTRITQESEFRIFSDETPPNLEILAPSGSVEGEARPLIRVAFSDGNSGIDPDSLGVEVDGEPITGCQVTTNEAECLPPALRSGDHRLVVEIRDLAGNRSTAALEFRVQVDVAPPQLIIASPTPGQVIGAAVVDVTGTVTDDVGVIRFLVQGQEVPLTGEIFAVPVVLEPGRNAIRVAAFDADGNEVSAELEVSSDVAGPTILVEAPVEGEKAYGDSVTFRAEVLDAFGLAEVTVGSELVEVIEGFVEAPVAVPPDGLLEIRATDTTGNVSALDLQLMRVELPRIAIVEPVEGQLILSSSITVEGTYEGNPTSLEVNGVAATFSGGSFSAVVPPPTLGGLLTAVSTDADGQSAAATVGIRLDNDPPVVQIGAPRDGAVVFTESIPVSGLANDLVPGTVEGDDLSVTVNGVVADVSNRAFLAAAVPLVAGNNVIRAEAVDAAGNTSAHEMTVFRSSDPGPRLEIVSGDLQTATIGELLPERLEVRLLNETGLPEAGATVLFTLAGNDGELEDGLRSRITTTDAQGLASTEFRLGTRAGVASQLVDVSVPERGLNTRFHASALPGTVALVVPDRGTDQRGVVGQRLAYPLVAAVTDGGFNRLAGVPVTFSVTLGSGRLVTETDPVGSTTQTVLSDGDGGVMVDLVLGSEPGIANNVVTARVDGSVESGFAVFQASGFEPGDPAATSVSGVVLDATAQPVPSVTLSIPGTTLSTLSDQNGFFHLDGVPVGVVMLDADGSTTTRPGDWPHLEFELVTLPGIDNQLDRPIYMLRLDTGSGVFVDETTGGEITLPDMPGFALEIAPGSVTFPDGSRSGTVRVTPVHADRVPMQPNFGQQPLLVVTIQPSGAKFDPPARMTLPNLTGLAAGRVTEMYSFDHDLGSFVGIGPATVSEDGTVIRSNDGVGVVKAGWHCGGDPESSGTGDGCPECKTCEGDVCEVNQSKVGKPCKKPVNPGACRVDPKCLHIGVCLMRTLKVEGVEAKVNNQDEAKLVIGGGAMFTATVEKNECKGPLKYEWDFGDGGMATGASVSHTFQQSGTFNPKVTVTCEGCASESDSVEVKVGDLEIEPDPLFVASGGKKSLQPNVMPGCMEPDSSFTSANPGIARLTSSTPPIEVQGVSPGTTQIQGALLGATLDTSTVHVVGASFDPNPISLCEGDTVEVTANVTPPEAESMVTVRVDGEAASASGSPPSIQVTGQSAGTGKLIAEFDGEEVGSADVEVVGVESEPDVMVMPDGEPPPEDPQEFGRTDTSSVSAEITACRRNGEWCAILEKVTGHYFIRSKLPTFPSTGPVQEVVCTGNTQTSNTNADNYRCQIGDLIDGGTGFNNFPTCRPENGWYVLDAVEAHEAYHETRLQPSLESVAAGAGSLFESVCVPDVGQGQAAAIGQLQSDPAFEQAEDALFQQWDSEYERLLADDHGDPVGTGGAYAAQRSKTRSVEQCICSMAAANGWGPCP